MVIPSKLFVYPLLNLLFQFVKGREVNPHAKEAWKVTKSGVRGKQLVSGWWAGRC